MRSEGQIKLSLKSKQEALVSLLNEFRDYLIDKSKIDYLNISFILEIAKEDILKIKNEDMKKVRLILEKYPDFN
jgi:predicted amidohydrolase